MSPSRCTAWLVCLLTAAPLHAAPRQAAGDGGWKTLQSIDPGISVAAMRTAELDGEPGLELLVIGAAGEVLVWSWSEAGRLEPVGGAPLVLPEPQHTILALGDVLGVGAPQLVTISPSGTRLYSTRPDGSFDPEGRFVSRRARFHLRTDVPRFTNVISDLDGDGRLDIVVPGKDAFELWRNESEADGTSSAEPGGGEAGADAVRQGTQLRRTATVELKLDRSARSSAEALSDELLASLTIPRLRTEDVNGDGRPDLLVFRGDRRAYHLQREDGSYPAEPDVAVDLSIFRDTSPESSLRPGEIIGGDGRQHYSRDLDGDGIPDHVISHRRKVWVFHGTTAGPQFTQPTKILKVADDVTAMTILPLNDDAFPDLLLLKLEVPSVAALILGLLDEWNVSLRAVGYANRGGRDFELDPKWKRELTMQLPPILDIVRKPEAIFERFDAIDKRIQDPTEGDFDGDERTDLLLVTADGRKLQHWRGQVDRKPATEGEPLRDEGEELLRRVLFEDKETLWTIDRAVDLFSSVAESRFAELTANRAPDSVHTLRDPATHVLCGANAGDLDGDGRDELLLYYKTQGGRFALSMDVVRVP